MSKEIKVQQYDDASHVKNEWCVLYACAMGGRRTVEECKALRVRGDVFTDPVTRFGWNALGKITRTNGAFGEAEIAAMWDSEVLRLQRTGTDLMLRLDGRGFAYELFTDTRHHAHPSTLETFANTIVDRHDFKLAQQTLADCLEKARSWDGSPSEFVQEVQKKVFMLQTESSRNQHDFREDVGYWYADHKAAYGTHKGLRGISYGFPSVDRDTGGMRPGDTIIIGGPTGGGKTVFAWNVVVDHALRGGRPLVYSLEMKRDDLMERCLYSVAKVSANKYTKGTLTAEEVERLDEAAEKLSQCYIRLNDKFGSTITEIEADARAKHYVDPCTLIVIDNAQIVDPGAAGAKNDERVNLMSVSIRAKILAGDLGVPVVIISQQNEQGNTSGSKKFEQDCSAYLSIGYCDTQDGIPKDQQKYIVRRTITKRKGRYGDGDPIYVLFYKDQTRFEEEMQYDDIY